MQGLKLPPTPKTLMKHTNVDYKSKNFYESERWNLSSVNLSLEKLSAFVHKQMKLYKSQHG